MKDGDKTKEQLLSELAEARQRIAELDGLAGKHKQAEGESNKATARHQLLMDNSIDGIWFSVFDKPIDITLPEAEIVRLINEREIIVEASDSLAKMYGFDEASQLVGKRWTELISADDNSLSNSELVRSHYKVDRRVRTEKDWRGNIAYYEDSEVCNIVDNKLVSSFGLTRDTTERKKAEEEVAERVKELSCLYGFARIADRPEIALNEIYQEVVQILPVSWQYSEITCAKISIGDKEFKTENYRESDWKQLSDIKVHGKKAGIVAVCYLEEKPELDEGPFMKEERLLIDAVAERLGRIIERKQEEEELRRHQEHLEELVEERTAELSIKDNAIKSSINAVGIVDLEGRLTYVNPSLLSMWEYDSEEEVLGRIAAETLWESPKDVQKTMEVIASKGYWIGEIIGKKKDGSTFDAQLSASMIYDESGEPAAMMAFFLDLTKRKQMEERLLTSERLATLGQFSGSISHELRNPLGVIDSSVYYLKRKLEDADRKVQEHLDRIESSVGSSTAIIESFLNLTRMKEPRLAKLDLRTIISVAIATSKVPRTVNVVGNFPVQELLIDADGEQLRMAFKNIIRNAVEAMNDKGTLTITIGNTPEGQAEVSFADTGPGIAPENLEKVFQPLFSTRAKGIGFGLSIARMIIDKHGGTIAAKSEPGEGAVFTIRLP